MSRLPLWPVHYEHLLIFNTQQRYRNRSLMALRYLCMAIYLDSLAWWHPRVAEESLWNRFNHIKIKLFGYLWRRIEIQTIWPIEEWLHCHSGRTIPRICCPLCGQPVTRFWEVQRLSYPHGAIPAVLRWRIQLHHTWRSMEFLCAVSVALFFWAYNPIKVWKVQLCKLSTQAVRFRRLHVRVQVLRLPRTHPSTFESVGDPAALPKDGTCDTPGWNPLRRHRSTWRGHWCDWWVLRFQLFWCELSNGIGLFILCIAARAVSGHKKMSSTISFLAREVQLKVGG